MVMAKYDKDQYEILLRQLDSLKQSASVLEYQAEFEKLAHGVLLYNPAFDDTFFVTRFVSGLRDEIRSALLLHRPKDVDTASALVLIQEQELEQGNAKSSGRDFTRLTGPKNTAVEPIKPIIKTTKTEAEDKLASLESFRHRNGLCFKCGEKWSPAHTCPAHVSLHVLEEILDALDIAQSNDDEDSDGDSAETPQEVLTVQSVPVPQQKSRQTLKLLAQIGKHKGHCFVSDAKVLPLKCYDLILGEDWLEDYSPMLVDYKLKTLQFSVEGKTVHLHGVRDNPNVCTPDQTVKQHNIPASVAEVLSKHAHLFSEPVGLPPRSADHRIPLIPGAQPVKKLVEGYEDDEQAKRLMTELAISADSHPGYKLQNGVLSGIGGHSGVSATYARVKQLFARPSMKQSVQEFVKQCQICQQAKTKRIKSSGLLNPLPEQAWEIISLDFVEGLPQSDNYNALLVVIDKFTKYGHFILIKHPFTALQVAQIFMNNVTSQKLSFRYYGPFKILQRFGQVAYKLDLPDDAKIHLVVHVTQLKQHIFRVLSRHSILRGATVVPQLLIHWSELPPELATWEDENKIPKALRLGE
ncbi:unnamed protein product [Miscanthus lutarioriparius]|uniref:Uncharacterized protein n=1 Tax=Miscanthus lutarioriparius TaxID=422564 RepID=A0A811RBG4_9POAL|nr:unnamed protein product [Miscanthus lutarioriparius]